MKRSLLYSLTLAALALLLLSGCSRTNRKTQPDANPHSGQPPAASSTLPQLKALPTQPAQVSPSEAPASKSSQPQAAATAATQKSQNSAELNNLADEIDKSLNSLQNDIDSTDPLNDVP